MVSKQMIMSEWREFVRRKDAMTEMYTQDRQLQENRDAELSPRYGPGVLSPGSPARAPASLAEHPQQVQEA